MKKSFNVLKRKFRIPPLGPLGPYFRSDVNRRNFWFGVTNGVLYAWAEALTDPSLVLTCFTSLLTSSKFIVGLMARSGAPFCRRFRI